jgi:ClpP class serine protease
MVLEAKRYSGKEALENSIVDWLGGIEEVLKIVAERKLNEKAKTGVYGKLKMEMWRETLSYLGQEGYEREENRTEVEWEKDEENKAEGERRVQEWKRNATKAKL